MNDLQGRLLIVDDEPVALGNLAHAFQREAYRLHTCDSGQAAMALLSREGFDVVLSDMRMPEVDGLALLRHCRAHHPELQFILLTAHATLDSAVTAMKEGAFDYRAKPYRIDDLRHVVAQAMELVRLKRANQELEHRTDLRREGIQIVTQDPVMLRLLKTAQRVATTDSNILIEGESGTGKELLARFVHAHSQHKKGPFIAVNCGALNDELLDNELFGHERGAFTGAMAQKRGLIEAAGNGTLFLDEIGETSPTMQVKLLRVIEQREMLRVGSVKPIRVAARFLSATNRDLEEAIEHKLFRRDLYYRLKVMELSLPPLRQRRGDIPLLAYFFLRKFSLLAGKSLDTIAPEVLQALEQHHYPGNVRELSNILERGVALAEGNTLELHHLPEHLLGLCHSTPSPATDEPAPLPTLEEQEEEYIRLVLARTGGNRTQAARILGIDRVSLWRKLKRFGVAKPD